MRESFTVGCLLAASLPLAAQPAAAQSGGDVAIGYSYLTNQELAANATNLPAGFFFDSSLQVNDFLSIAMDVNGHFRRGIEASGTYAGGPADMPVRPLEDEDFQFFSFNRPEDEYCSPVLTKCEVHIQTVGAVAGPRFHVQAGGARPYFHALFGVSRSLRKIGFFAHTATHWAVQPGGGVDISMTPNTAFRIQADYRMTFFPLPNQADPGSQSSLVSNDGVDFRDFKLSFGFVFNLGARRE